VGEFWTTKKPEFANPMMQPHCLWPTDPNALDIERYREMREWCASTFGHKEPNRFGDLWSSRVHTRAFAFRHERHRMLFYMAFAEG